jgi:hypothetical protein
MNFKHCVLNFECLIAPFRCSLRLNFCGYLFKQAVPEEVWDCGSSVRVLDVCHNSIEEIPQKIAALKSLNVILLSRQVC